ncbi:hypothetical protein K502DRAFT_315969 [Neoconidiobolus thromboides FSU 785]|nr:hypothetical protein K502DRAFT_315969 [Neoconidiobolus thromboides FSU 785]
MLIKRLPNRKISPLPPFLRSLVQRIFEANGAELTIILKDIMDKNLPKSDLNNWIGVLNKFDGILEKLIEKYSLTKIQRVNFAEEDREQIIGILSLTKILFDKCTNRNLYCSYERLNEFLNTNDLDVLELVLMVIMRPAQRVNSQRSVRVNFLIAQERVASLLQRWTTAAHHIGVKGFISDDFEATSALENIIFTFRPDDTKELESSTTKKDIKSSSHGKNYTQTMIKVKDPYSKGSNTLEIFETLIKEYNIPEKYHHELFHKIRVTTSLKDYEKRLKLLSIKLLAISIYCYVADEDLAFKLIFIHEQTFVADMVSILESKDATHLGVQSSALNALDSIAHFPGKLSDVLASVGANVNHGSLVSFLKRVMALEHKEDPNFMRFTDSLFSFLVFIFTSQSGGSMLITAGIVPLLANFLRPEMAESPIRLLYKGIQLLDNSIYGFPAAFASFQESDGLPLLVERIKNQIDSCIFLKETHKQNQHELRSQVEIVENLILLKGMSKFVLHMMQSYSTGVGLRNLIDSTLPESLKKVFTLPEFFSPTVYGQAVNIMSTIIHNEPTSLSILQEQDLPQTLLKHANQKLPLSGDSLYTISNALGAICLNEIGLKMVKESGIINNFFSLFSSPEYICCLDEADVVPSLGSSFDELIRHQPSLKELVIDNIISVLKSINIYGKENYSIFVEEATPFLHKNDEEVMRGHLIKVIEEASDSPDFGALHKEETIDQFFVRMIESICRFLDGFFQGQGQAANTFDIFVERGGLEPIFDFYSLEPIHHNFTNTNCSITISQVFQSCTESILPIFINTIFTKLNEYISKADIWLNSTEYESYVYKLLKDTSPERKDKLEYFYSIVKPIRGLLDLIDAFFDSDLFSDDKMKLCLVEVFSSKKSEEFISPLARMFRVFQWDCSYMFEHGLIGKPKPENQLSLPDYEYADDDCKNVHAALHELNSHITTFYQNLARLTTISKKMDHTQKRRSKFMAKLVVDGVNDILLWDKVSVNLDPYSFKYYGTAIDFIVALLVDRKHYDHINIFVLMSLDAFRVTDQVFKYIEELWEFTNNYLLTRPLDDHAVGEGSVKHVEKVLNSILIFLEQINVFDNYNSSPHLNPFIPDLAKHDQDVALPNDILTKVRPPSYKILKVIWQSDQLNKLSKNHIRLLVGASNHIIRSLALKMSRNLAFNRIGDSEFDTMFSTRREEATEERITQLTDMGFSRAAARIALTRRGNNVTRAADYLIDNPAIVAEAEFEAPPEDQRQSGLETTNTEGSDHASESAEIEASNSNQDQVDTLDHLPPLHFGSFYLKEEVANIPTPSELEKISNDLILTALSPCMNLIDNNHDCIYPVRDFFINAFSAPSIHNDVLTKYIKEQITDLLDQKNIRRYKLLSIRFRLLGFLLYDESTVNIVLGVAKDLTKDIYAIATSLDFNFWPDDQVGCVAITFVLLDILLMYSEVPELEEVKVKLGWWDNSTLKDVPLIDKDFLSTDEKAKLVKVLLKCVDHKDQDLKLAIFRLLSRLTKYEELTSIFFDADGFKVLMEALHKDTDTLGGVQKYFVSIFRHLTESRSLLLYTMESIIKGMFIHPKNRFTVDINNMVNGNVQMIYRNPKIFVEAVNNVCTINEFNPNISPQLVLLNDQEKDQNTSENATQVVSIPPLDTLPILMIHFLAFHLMEYSNTGKNPNGPITTDSEEHRMIRCTILHLLTEIFYCFSSCRVEYLTSRKHKLIDNMIPDFKFYTSRTQFITFLLNDLLLMNVKEANEEGTLVYDDERMNAESNWTIMLLCSFLSGTNDELIDSKSNELIPIRKFILELIAKAFNEALLIPDVDIKYEKLMVLCNLCSKILTDKKTFFAVPTPRVDEKVSISIGKIMLDKNFVQIFINIIDDLDLNYPDLNKLVSSIFVCLDAISKIATKLGEKKINVQDLENNEEIDDDDEISYSSSGEDEAEDMLRNSALGVMSGSANIVEDEIDDIDMDDEDMQDEIGYSTDASDETDDDMSGASDLEDSEFDSLLDMEDVEGEELDEGDIEGSIVNSEDDEGQWHAEIYDPEDEDEDEDEEGGTPTTISDPMAEDNPEFPLRESNMNAVDIDLEDDDNMLPETDFGFDNDLPHVISGTFELDPESTSVNIQQFAEIARLARFFMNPRGTGSHDQPPRSSLLQFDISANNEIGSLTLGPNGAQESIFGFRRNDRAERTLHPLISNERVVPHQYNQDGSSVHGPGINASQGLPSGRAEFISRIFGRAAEQGGRGDPFMDGLFDGVRGSLRQNIHGSASPYSFPETGPPQIPQKPSFKELTINSTVLRWRSEMNDLCYSNVQEQCKRIIPSILNVMIPKLKDIKPSDSESSNLAETANKGTGANASSSIRNPSTHPSDTMFSNESNPGPFQYGANVFPIGGSSQSRSLLGVGQNRLFGQSSNPSFPPFFPRNRTPQLSDLSFGSNENRPPQPASDSLEANRPSESADASLRTDRSSESRATSAIRELFETSGDGPPGEPGFLQAGGIDLGTFTLRPSGSTDEASGLISNRPQSGLAVREEAANPGSSNSDLITNRSEEPSISQPVTITIHGNVVDITNTGIDPTFLEALPDDLRQEVISQHFESNPSSVPVSTSIGLDSEFLEELPQEVRSEVLQIERDQNEQTTEQVTNENQDRSALGIITNNFPRFEALNSSRVTNREPQGSQYSRDFADMLRSRERFGSEALHRRARNPFLGLNSRRRFGDAYSQDENPKEAIKIVDHQELATIFRLLFLPFNSNKTLIFKVLHNLSENPESCGELILLIISILQDGAENLESIDKTLVSLSLKPKQLNLSKSIIQALESDVPNLVPHRCLDLLNSVFTRWNHGLRLFMNEYDQLVSRRPQKKSKHKNQNSKHPIVLLISLLDRPRYLDNNKLLDQLTNVVSIASRQLASMVKYNQSKVKDETSNDKKDPTTSNLVTKTDNKELSTSNTITKEPSGSTENKTSKPTFRPPHIHDHCLKSIIIVLTSNECSNKSFQHTLSAIQSLSVLAGAEKVFVDELIKQSHAFCDFILKDLQLLENSIETEESSESLQSLIVSRFSPASSHQSKLLRMLKTLDYMQSRKHSLNKRSGETDKNSIFSKSNFNLGTLDIWNLLSQTLDKIQEGAELFHLATALLPLIEAFMVICKHSGDIDLHLKQTSDLSDASNENIFYQFTEKHRKLLNSIIRNNPSLMSGTFSLLIRNHKVLDFDNKRTYFNLQLHKRTPTREAHNTLQLNVRRQYVFEDSFRQFQGRNGNEIKYSKINVKFHDEEGVDAGGVTREWFTVLSHQMFDPNYALFISSSVDKVTHQPNKASHVNPEHLHFFKFVGRMIGKAIFSEVTLDAYFTRSFYKHILGKPVEFKDLEANDKQFYDSMVWTLENDITEHMFLTFSDDIEIFGEKKIIPLKPDGENIPVTEENKKEYVKLITEFRLYTAIKDQIDNFLTGFHEIIPKDLIAIFDEQELELLISGLPDIDIDDWKNNTTYQGYTQSSAQIQWFWRAVRSFDQSERAKLLQFATGTSKVPLGGFNSLQGSNGVQKFQIHRDFASSKRLPSAHTW